MSYINLKPGQKPAITSFAPTLSAFANCTKTGQYFKNADGQAVISFRVDASGALGGASALVFTLPNSLALDTTKYLGTVAGDDSTSIKLPLQGYWWDQGAAPRMIGARSVSTTTFELHDHGNGVVNANQVAAGDSLDITLTLWVTGVGF